jgi:hypothetical protein
MNVSKDQRISIAFEHNCGPQDCVIDGAARLARGGSEG